MFLCSNESVDDSSFRGSWTTKEGSLRLARFPHPPCAATQPLSATFRWPLIPPRWRAARRYTTPLLELQALQLTLRTTWPGRKWLQQKMWIVKYAQQGPWRKILWGTSCQHVPWSLRLGQFLQQTVPQVIFICKVFATIYPYHYRKMPTIVLEGPPGVGKTQSRIKYKR